MGTMAELMAMRSAILVITDPTSSCARQFGRLFYIFAPPTFPIIPGDKFLSSLKTHSLAVLLASVGRAGASRTWLLQGVTLRLEGKEGRQGGLWRNGQGYRRIHLYFTGVGTKARAKTHFQGRFLHTGLLASTQAPEHPQVPARGALGPWLLLCTFLCCSHRLREQCEQSFAPV